MDRFTELLTRVSDFVGHALKLQAMWLVGTLAGGLVLGFGPATLATVDAAERMRHGDAATWRRAAGIWRANLWRAQLSIGIPGVLLFCAVSTLTVADAPVPAKIPAALGAVVIVVGLLHLPVIELTYAVPAGTVFKKSLLLAVGQLPMTLLMLAVLVIWAGVCYKLPGLIPFLGIGIPALGISYLAHSSIERNEELLKAEHA